MTPPGRTSSSFSQVLEKLHVETGITMPTLALFHASPLIVFSHLRWEFVKQRPQHLLERLAVYHHVYFVEEPIADEVVTNTPRSYRVNSRITVVQPRLTGPSGDIVLAQWLQRQADVQRATPLLWFYSPAFINMVELLPSNLIVYDCMDELSAFKGASALLQSQERQLLNVADVVFTGGKSLFLAKQRLHPHVHCFPSSVDADHFAQARQSRTNFPQDLAVIPGPRVGFYGVLDERLDTVLLAEIADASPDVSFVMMGPVVKISESDLPQRPNLYYLGAKNYADLPKYLKGIDIAFMPFAINEATKCISPTKTLEFMAAQKPIISTPIRDVVSDYSHVVSICRTAAEVADAIQYYLDETPSDRQVRHAAQGAILARTSWDETASQMHRLMALGVESKVQQEEWSTQTWYPYSPATVTSA